MKRYLSYLCLMAACCACSKTPPLELDSSQSCAYVLEEGEHSWAPIFVAEQTDLAYNRIGTPAADISSSGEERVFVDPSTPSLYVQTQDFQTAKGHYRNYIYRAHFEKTPTGFSAGQNVGLMAIVTVDENKNPILITTVHTCGCYAAIVPTDHLDPSALPKGWDPNATQEVHGEELPSILAVKHMKKPAIAIALRSGSHRVAKVWADEKPQLTAQFPPRATALRPMDALRSLEMPTGETTSFFIEEGEDKGLVKGSEKPKEKLLMSWWTFDDDIGEDKAFGDPEETGQRFYTSLAFWKRDVSNLWDFASFLEDRGWQL